MICPKCKSIVNENSNFCPNCGQKLNPVEKDNSEKFEANQSIDNSEKSDENNEKVLHSFNENSREKKVIPDSSVSSMKNIENNKASKKQNTEEPNDTLNDIKIPDMPKDLKTQTDNNAEKVEVTSKHKFNLSGKKIYIGVAALAVLFMIFAVYLSGPQIDSIELNYTSAALDLDNVGKLEPTIQPADSADAKVTWKSSDTSIATVDENGYIYPKKLGETTITAKAGNKTASCTIKIIEPGPDFSEIYYDYLDSSYATLASDESYLEIDTNPNDIDDYTDSDALAGLVSTIDVLGLPDSIIQEMSHTRALDGKQTKTYDELTVTWTYHPNNGLEVLFLKE